jgi:hypothetical protein
MQFDVISGSWCLKGIGPERTRELAPAGPALPGPVDRQPVVVAIRGDGSYFILVNI